MTPYERTETLILAESHLSIALELMARVLNPERSAEIAKALVDDKLARLSRRRSVMAAVARQEAHQCSV